MSPRTTASQRLGRMAREISKLRTLTTDVLTVEPHSSLIRDDAAFPRYPASSLAWQGIGSAVDHLDMMICTLEATRTAFPFGYHTLARTGLIGAARALWVLDGTRTERIGRALRMAHDEYRQERAALTDTRSLFPDLATDCDQRMTLLDRRMAEARTAGTQIGMTDREVRDKPKDTEIIGHVARRFAIGEPEPDNITASYVLGWRDGSGIAHAMLWPALRRSVPIRQAGPGRSHHKLTTDIDEIAHAAARVHLLTDKAVELFDRRRRSAVAASAPTRWTTSRSRSASRLGTDVGKPAATASLGHGHHQLSHTIVNPHEQIVTPNL